MNPMTVLWLRSHSRSRSHTRRGSRSPRLVTGLSGEHRSKARPAVFLYAELLRKKQAAPLNRDDAGALELFRSVLRQQPKSREAIAGLVRLATVSGPTRADAAKWVTGAEFVIDGGYTAI